MTWVQYYSRQLSVYKCRNMNLKSKLNIFAVLYNVLNSVVNKKAIIR